MSDNPGTRALVRTKWPGRFRRVWDQGGFCRSLQSSSCASVVSTRHDIGKMRWNGVGRTLRTETGPAPPTQGRMSRLPFSRGVPENGHERGSGQKTAGEDIEPRHREGGSPRHQQGGPELMSQAKLVPFFEDAEGSSTTLSGGKANIYRSQGE